MDHALKTIKIVLCLTSIVLAVVFSIISTYLNHNNANKILFDSYTLAAENTSRSIAYGLKIGDLNLVQARLNDLYSVVQAEKIYIFDSQNREVVSVPTFSSNEKDICRFKSINTPVKYDGQSLGFLFICFKPVEFKIAHADFSTILWFFFSFGALFLFIFKLIQNRFAELKFLFNQISALNPENPALQLPEGDLKYPENKLLVTSINAMILRIQTYEKDLEKMRISEHLAKLAAQVSHDIRSPLSALNLVYSNLREISEEKRLLIRRSIQRINDIANDLLSKGRSSVGNRITDSKLEMSNSLLSAELDSIISEKRIEYREKINVDISVTHPEVTYGIFAEINPIDFKRIVSNLINNSVEAFNGTSGLINVSIEADNENAEVIIKDNGPGIPEKILSKLGSSTISFGKNSKTSGSGLGIYHAKKSIQNMGGILEIDSKVNHGTTVRMKFPRSKTPSWFVEKIILYSNYIVVSLDDDTAIHGLWMSKLKELQHNSNGIKLFSFSSIENLTEWHRSQIRNSSNILYLIDYELLGQDKNGIDVIESLQIENQSILVTSRYDDHSIKERCENLKIRMIPKEIAGFIPIELRHREEVLDYVLIDDDPLVLSTWSLNAKNKKHNIKLFRSFKKFEIEANNIARETTVYIDSNLGFDEQGNPMKGEELALNLVNLGFRKIYLTTGENANQFITCPYITGIIGKDPI